MVDLNVDPVARYQLNEVGQAEGFRNKVYAEPAAFPVHVVDRQAGPVQANKALIEKIADDVRRKFKPDPDRFPALLYADNRGNAPDVAVKAVAAVFPAGDMRALDVNLISDREVPHRGERIRLVGDVKGGEGLLNACDRKAGAVQGHAGPDERIAEQRIVVAHRERLKSVAEFDIYYRFGALHYACVH